MPYRNLEKGLAQRAAWREANVDKARASVRKWNDTNYEKVLAASRKWKAANREKLRAQQTEQREVRRQAQCARRAANRAQARAEVNARRHRTRQATPPWADRKAIVQFYKNCPAGYHVDHVIPLKGKTVCGLHVETNLQYLPARENIAKHNKLLT